MDKSKTAAKPSRSELLEQLRVYHGQDDRTIEWFCCEVCNARDLKAQVKECEDALTACCHDTDMLSGRVLTAEAIQKRRERKAAAMAEDGIDYYADVDVQADEGRFLNVAFADGTYEDCDFNYWMQKLEIVGYVRDARRWYRDWTEADWNYVDGTIDVNPRD